MTKTLLELARKATPGEWFVCKKAATRVTSDPHAKDRGICTTGGYTTNSDDGEHVEENNANAAYIAAVSPERIIALCEFVEAFDAFQKYAEKYVTASTERTAMMDARRKLESFDG